MTRYEQIEEFIKFHAHKFSVRNGYTTTEDLMREMAQWCDNNPKSPWISVEERLPEIGQPCFLANFNKRRCGYGRFYADDGASTRWERKEGNSTMMYFLHEVTHWMPIPEIETNCK
jgi:hypothetical protein